MRTRARNIVDPKSGKEVYSFQFYWYGVWVYPGYNGQPPAWETSEERDLVRASFRRLPAPPRIEECVAIYYTTHKLGQREIDGEVKK